jgi:hypothetical protein
VISIYFLSSTCFTLCVNSFLICYFLDITSKVKGLKRGDPTYEMLQSRVSLFWASNTTEGEFTVRTVGTTESNKMAIEGDPNDLVDDEKDNGDFDIGDILGSAGKILGNAGNIIENSGIINASGHPVDEAKSTKISCEAGQFTGTIAIPQSTIRKWLDAKRKPQFWSFLKDDKDQKPKARLIKIQAYDDKTCK